MEIKRYKIGVCEIETRLPFNINDTFPFSQFRTENLSDNAYVYDYSFTDKIDLPDKKPNFEFDNRIVFNENSSDVVFYKKHGGGYFARRTEFKEGFGGTVEYSNEFKNSLWDKSVLDTVGFEKKAYDLGMMIMHASFIAVGGEGILFTAPRQTGKSTQARLWNEYNNAEIINGDKALVYIKDGRVFASGLPYCGSSNICLNVTVPVKCIVRLGRGENVLEKLSPFSAVREILNGCYLPFGIENILPAAEKTAEEVPVYKFDCKPDFSAVKTLEKELW